MEMPGAAPPPRLRWLYTRAVICQRFPAYKLEDVDDAPIVDLLQALELLNTADKLRATSGS